MLLFVGVVNFVCIFDYWNYLTYSAYLTWVGQIARQKVWLLFIRPCWFLAPEILQLVWKTGARNRRQFSGAGFWSVCHGHNNSVLINGRWRSAAGKVTVGLASHRPCVTDLPSLRLANHLRDQGLWKADCTPPTFRLDRGTTYLSLCRLVACIGCVSVKWRQNSNPFRPKYNITETCITLTTPITILFIVSLNHTCSNKVCGLFSGIWKFK